MELTDNQLIVLKQFIEEFKDISSQYQINEAITFIMSDDTEKLIRIKEFARDESQKLIQMIAALDKRKQNLLKQKAIFDEVGGVQ